MPLLAVLVGSLMYIASSCTFAEKKNILSHGRVPSSDKPLCSQTDRQLDNCNFSCVKGNNLCHEDIHVYIVYRTCSHIPLTLLF